MKLCYTIPISKSDIKTEERDNINTTNTLIHDRSLSRLCKGTLVKKKFFERVKQPKTQIRPLGNHSTCDVLVMLMEHKKHLESTLTNKMFNNIKM